MASERYDSEDDEQGRPGAPVDLGRLLHAVLRRWRYLPVAGAVGAVVGVAYALLFVNPEFSARATLLWDPHGDAPPSDRAFLTQVDSIDLPVNLMEAQRRLRLKIPVDLFRTKINLVLEHNSHLVAIEANGGDAKSAAALANTVVDVFLEYQRGAARARGEERLREVEADIEVHQAQLKNARDAYDAFRKQLGVSDFDVETKLAIEKAAQLKQQADMSGAEAISEDARQRQLAEEAQRQSPVTSAGSSMTNPDAIALAQARTQLTSARSHLAPDHPQIQQLEAQAKALEERVRTNSNVVQGTVSYVPNAQYVTLRQGLSQSKVSREAAIERQETFRKMALEAEKRLLQLSEAQGQAKQLQSRITLLDTRLTDLEAQRVRERDAVRNAAADFRVVTPATLPEYANPSGRRSTAIKFPIAAVGLVLLVIIGLELRGLRVHTAREAGYWANAAVIASSTWPRDPSTLGVLVDELSDAAPVLKGTTLVVGARVNEVPLAREVAYWLSHLTGFARPNVVGANEPIVTEAAKASTSTEPVNPTPSAAADGRFPLARRTEQAAEITMAQAWDGPPNGPSLRRAARLADRVLVIIASGTLSVADVAQLRSRLGRKDGIGVLVVGLSPELVTLPDRVGEVDDFWRARAA